MSVRYEGMKTEIPHKPNEPLQLQENIHMRSDN